MAFDGASLDAARLPEDLLARSVRRAGEDEQQIGETIQVDRDERACAFDAQDAALGSTADRPREVEARRKLGAAGKDERLQRLELGVRDVAVALEPFDLLLREAYALAPGLL